MFDSYSEFYYIYVRILVINSFKVMDNQNAPKVGIPPESSSSRPQTPAAPNPQPKGAASGGVPPQAGTGTSAGPAVKKPKQDKPPEEDQGIWRISRRNFFSVAGWAAFFVFLATSTVSTLRMMFPRILYEPPSAFKAGYPDDYIVGDVSEKYKDQYRVWIIREADGFYALLAICTHLGCTPRWLEAENKFKCPCHGSGFHKSGINFEGPAPRPLERLKITLADDGQILIDRNVRFRFENGDWNKPDAYLKYS